MATYQGQTVDAYEDFEDALGAPWSETDANSIINPADAAAKYAGAQGMSVTHVGAYAGYVACVTTEKSTVSIGYWWYSGTAANYCNIVTMFSGGGQRCRIWCRGSDSKIALRVANIIYSTATFSASTWYWITVKYTASGTCTLKIYDTAGSLLDTLTDTDASASNIDEVRWGKFDADNNTGYNYFDDCIIDWTTATFPLLGWAAAGGGPTLVAEQVTDEIHLDWTMPGD